MVILAISLDQTPEPRLSTIVGPSAAETFGDRQKINLP